MTLAEKFIQKQDEIKAAKQKAALEVAAAKQKLEDAATASVPAMVEAAKRGIEKTIESMEDGETAIYTYLNRPDEFSAWGVLMQELIDAGCNGSPTLKSRITEPMSKMAEAEGLALTCIFPQDSDAFGFAHLRLEFELNTDR